MEVAIRVSETHQAIRKTRLRGPLRSFRRSCRKEETDPPDHTFPHACRGIRRDREENGKRAASVCPGRTGKMSLLRFYLVASPQEGLNAENPDSNLIIKGEKAWISKKQKKPSPA